MNDSFLEAHSKSCNTGGMRTKGHIRYSSSEVPLVSVITVVYNGAEFIELTIKSVLDQIYENIEYIIVDGNSTDGTFEIIKKFDDVIDYWVSENDEGIADAMNKGLTLSTGEYVIYIHADDYLFDNQSLYNSMAIIGDSDILICNILYGKNKKILSPRGFNFWFFFKTGIYHQGAIVRRNVFNRIGYFDSQFKIAMDYDFFLRAYTSNVKVKKSNIVLSFMRDTGISSKKDWNSLLERFDEEKKVHYKNCGSILMRCLYSIYWCLYFSYRLCRQRLPFK